MEKGLDAFDVVSVFNGHLRDYVEEAELVKK
jgi:hypothetical protein